MLWFRLDDSMNCHTSICELGSKEAALLLLLLQSLMLILNNRRHLILNTHLLGLPTKHLLESSRLPPRVPSPTDSLKPSSLLGRLHIHLLSLDFLEQTLLLSTLSNNLAQLSPYMLAIFSKVVAIAAPKLRVGIVVCCFLDEQDERAGQIVNVHVIPDGLAAANDGCSLDLEHGFCELVDLTTAGEGRSAAIAIDGRWTHDGGLDCTRGVCAGVDDDLIHILVEGFLWKTDQFRDAVQVVKDFVGVFA